LVNEAYQVLSDPAKRAEYDAQYDAIAQAQEELTEPEELLRTVEKVNPGGAEREDLEI
jgi:curved DNA-binding protein CbpA